MSHILGNKDIVQMSNYLDLIRTNGYTDETIEYILEELKPVHKDYPISIEITSNGYPAYFAAYQNIIHISNEPLKNYVAALVDGMIKIYPHLENQRKELFAYTVFFVLIHEVEHTYQYMFGERYLNPQYEVIGDAYKKIVEIKEEKMSVLKFRILLNRYKSQKDKAHFVLERNANVEAYDLLHKLSKYESNNDINRLMYNQLLGYKVCGYTSLKYNGAFEESFKITWRKRLFNELDFTEEIPIDEKIRYGFPIEDEERMKILKQYVNLHKQFE